MAISNHERVGRALKLFHKGLYPFFEREMANKYGKHWPVRAATYLTDKRCDRPQLLQTDLYSFLKVMWGEWNDVFRETLGKADRSLLSECQDIRNTWAHSNTSSTDDAYRAFDSMARLLSSVSAPEVSELEKQKQELLRLRFEDQARRETRKSAVVGVEGSPMVGLKPWREIVTPHPDVASGRYQQAEFAADLWQVYLDEGSDEYRLPTEFFERTYLTEGLTQLLSNALRRLNGQGADPVIELQTNFGGGKTHAMLALYHLCFGLAAKDLPGLEPILEETGIAEPPQGVNTAVIVGNKISPGQPHTKSDGTVVHTLWGEIAWQLGGLEGYEMIRLADETATNPGDQLKAVFNKYSPCLVLVDEWVAYARQLHYEKDLPAGTFDTHFTFAQTLSESAKNADRTLLVVSIPASDIEIGGNRGQEALERLKNAIGRVESPWRPATAEESFEIVRRRLFQDISSDHYVARDAVIRAFSELYQSQPQDFPAECREGHYRRRLEEAYPIHPEFFDRLYSDWSSLDKFQRTRGVLRLMAKVIHTLWERDDRSLLIMPAHVPMDASQVQSELTRYLDDNWIPIIEKDVDGPNSLPLSLDRDNPNLGRYSACRRVTRSIFVGSAPTVGAANRGLEEHRIKLGCIQPGESVAIFGDALRRLTDQATYLYVDSNRYWVSTQPNVTRTAQDRATQLLGGEPYAVWDEIIKRLKSDSQRGDFGAVHTAPESTADIPDDPHLGVRLVILHPKHAHNRQSPDSVAQKWVEEILNKKGSSPRYFKNTLMFLAPDKAKLENLERQVAQYLAWNSIVQDREALNLDVFQNNQANTKKADLNNIVKNILSDAYQWLLIPTQQDDPQGSVQWKETRLQGQDSSILQASRKAVHEGDLYIDYGPANLRLEALDPYLWVESNHIDIKRLWEYLTQYLYLPRIKNSAVLIETIQNGVASTVWTDNYAYAEGWDEATQRYLGLKVAEYPNPSISRQCLLVKPEIAAQQIEKEGANSAISQQPTFTENGHSSFGVASNGQSQLTPSTPLTLEPDFANVLRRYYGNVSIDALRINRDTSNITNEVIQHLTKLQGAKVKITMEIEAEIPEGVPEDVIRTISENCKTLKFTTHNFEAS